MNMKSPTGTESTGPSLKIKGRLMPQKDFLPRFQTMCNSFGLTNLEFPAPGSFKRTENDTACDVNNGQKNAIIMLSCKVRYNPRWGSLTHHPQQITATGENKGEPSFPELIDPFLRLYRQAQNQIYLSQTTPGEYFISLPATYLNNTEPKQGCSLFLNIEKMIVTGEDGAISPIAKAGNRLSFVVSPGFRQTLKERNFVWSLDRKIQIREYLTADLFDFACAKDHTKKQSSHLRTLFPHLRKLVTHKTPHLRAAEIYLQQQYQRIVDIWTTERNGAHHDLVCVAGLEIDMRSTTGHGEQYFVPWKAYLKKTERNGCEKYAFDQDELFVQLMQRRSLTGKSSSAEQ